MKEEQSADDIDSRHRQPPRPAKENDDGDVEIDRRQNAHGAAKIKAAHADGAALLLFVKKKAGNEISADNKEDIHTGAAVEDGVPDARDMVIHVESLQGMQRDDQKDRQGAQPVKTWNAGHRCSSRGEGLGHAGGLYWG